MTLPDYPRPPSDSGLGLHWIPTVRSAPEMVDRFVGEAKAMGASWVVFLNDGTNVGDNDYLVKKLVENGIEPVMRIYSPSVAPIGGDVEGMVRHYRALGVDYFQIFNEPNLKIENDGRAPSVEHYLDHWIPVARRVTAAGGLPGFGALAPGGDVDDLRFLRDALDGVKARGAVDVLDRAWLSLHNYTGNRPIEFTKDSNGFLKFRWYDAIMREKLGRSLPIVGTEGGTYMGNQFDPSLPAVDAAKLRDIVVDSAEYMDGRPEPYFFANTLWCIANQVGGGHDPQWEPHALITSAGPGPAAQALRDLA